MEAFIAKMDDALYPIVCNVNTYLSNYILVFMLVAVGLWYSIKTGFVQIRCFGEGMRKVFGNLTLNGKKHDSGMSSFQALATAIAAQVGTGNIVGASGAILAGGPGAIFWMWVIAFFGMATIYAEATMAIKTRVKAADGTIHGGPVYYITTAFKGGFGKFLATFFAVAIILALGFMGCMVQSNSIGECFQTAFGIPSWIVVVALVIICGMIFLGGVQRLAAVTEKIVPIMAAIFLLGGLVILIFRTFQGEYFVDRYGKEAVKHTPPVAKMLALDVPVGLGTDATRVASYNPWTALYWLVSGRTVGGMAMYDDANRLPRDVALELWTAGSAWFSSEQGKKGRLAAGQLADLVVLSKDYFSVAEEEIKGIESVLTVVDGKVVYAAGHFSPLAPPPIPVLPEWSPVVKVPGHYRSAPPATAKIGAMVQMHQCCGSCGVHGHQHDIARKSSIPVSDEQAFWGVLGCSCFAF